MTRARLREVLAAHGLYGELLETALAAADDYAARVAEETARRPYPPLPKPRKPSGVS